MTLEHLAITPEHRTRTQTRRTMILASWIAFLAIWVVRVAFLAATWVTRTRRSSVRLCSLATCRL